MAEQDILTHIKELVAAEHELRSQEAAKQIDPDDARRQLAELEVTLDQCWDLLRDRRARIEAGEPPDEARVNPASQVEGYLQ
jgi:hypothetical protein